MYHAPQPKSIFVLKVVCSFTGHLQQEPLSWEHLWMFLSTSHTLRMQYDVYRVCVFSKHICCHVDKSHSVEWYNLTIVLICSVIHRGGCASCHRPPCLMCMAHFTYMYLESACLCKKILCNHYCHSVTMSSD